MLLGATSLIAFVFHQSSSDAAEPTIHVEFGGDASEQPNTLIEANHLDGLFGFLEYSLRFLHKVLEAMYPRPILVQVAQHLLRKATKLLAGCYASVPWLGGIVVEAIIVRKHLRNSCRAGTTSLIQTNKL